jgi:hypothetical protein
VILLASFAMVTRRTTARKKRAVRPLGNLGGSPARRTSGWVVLVLGALVVVNLYVFVWDKQTSVGAIRREADRATPTATVPSRPLAPPAPAPAPAPPSVPGAAAPAASIAAGSAAATAPAGVTLIEGKVGKSDTLGRVLKKSGLSAAETDEVIRALSGAFDFRTLRPGQTFRIERGRDGRVQVFELAVGKGRGQDRGQEQTVRAERSAAGAMVGKASGRTDSPP